ncbi:hypothetical protein ACI78V_05095 [Geodermatophilus sp. SYSU D00742]
MIDLRAAGFPNGVLGPTFASFVPRASRLLVGLLHSIHESLVTAVIAIEPLVDDAFITRADELLAGDLLSPCQRRGQDDARVRGRGL